MTTNSMTAETVDRTISEKAVAAGLWTLQLLLALNFLFAGGAKLVGMGPMVLMFDQLGVGQWFRYATGALEIGGAVLLLIPGAAGLGIAGLAMVMVGATLAELLVLSGSPIMPLALLGLLLLLAFARRRSSNGLSQGRPARETR